MENDGRDPYADERTRHVPVMLREVLSWLSPRPGQTVVDGTLGGGGHTEALLHAVLPDGKVLALDRDPIAVARAKVRFAGLPVHLVQANFRDLPELLDELGWECVDGIVLDLGLSSDQLADRDRGFSFSSDGPLDMRFDPQEGEPAWRLVNRLNERALADLIHAFGEERFARRIARAIAEERRFREIKTARELTEIIHRVVPRPRFGGIDSATRTFQALRIAVNKELDSLESALKRIPEVLRPGGRLVVISFHSLEDRIVKEAFRNDPRYSSLTKKPVTPAEEELTANPRSRSAKLRAAART
ncbi:MAG: 16S rRNA (cytosine(1402)-N(4))-methyltransferase RsmH [Thermogutta sp.]|nr:16S rRNA (cytosine(1402)-N(4))-methyltransferase RsmH [Thermogutta sp.]